MATVADPMSVCAFREHPKQLQLHYRRPFTEYSKSKQLQDRKTFKLRTNSCWSQRSISGGKKVEEIVKQAKEMTRKSAEEGPPRWFTPLDCGKPPPNAPLLLYLPGIDGTGLGMASHHQSLGELFEVQCLHIPVMNGTSFEGLLTFVEGTLKWEFRHAPSRPIYLVGESLGGSLGLALAANNPDMDLVLVLVNPATCFSKSPLRPWFSLMEILNEKFYSIIPFTHERLWTLAKTIPRESLLWKFRMLQSAELYTNPRLHLVNHNVLLIVSGKDEFLPSGEEALRLKSVLKNCKIRYFKDSGHTLLLEEQISLSTIIKGVGFYRHSRTHDYVSDFVPPTREEWERTCEIVGILRRLTSPVMFSTNHDGKIVKGLSGLPQEGPVLFVGLHMLMGLELGLFVSELFKQRNILLRVLVHPVAMGDLVEKELQEPHLFDRYGLHGAVPVSGMNLLKLLSSKSFILLYPGGVREALHRKGEQYKLFWPEKAEFVRMAARFEATIIPFGIVGEDDIAEVVLDYDDLIKIPILNQIFIKDDSDIQNIRNETSGEVSNQKMYIPFIVPKPPGRFYFLFGKPIPTTGRKDELRDKANAHNLYLQIKREVEGAISYLLQKREKDPYRHFLPRFLYEAVSRFTHQMPTFDP